jgi:hypothetical protein
MPTPERPTLPPRKEGMGEWLTAQIAISRSPFYSENKVIPLKLFMDQDNN